MGQGSFIDIIIFALIAGFLVFKLRSVLGKRHGEERERPNPFAQGDQEQPGAEGDNVVPMPGRRRKAEGSDASPAENYHPDYGDTEVGRGIAEIRAQDPSFEPAEFLEGAQEAFRMIVDAFAQGNLTTLRSLLAEDVYNDFETAIHEREQAGESLETHIDAMTRAEIVDARLAGRLAKVTVKFVTSQRNITRDSEGNLLDGDVESPVEITDIWTFVRDVRATDPNWMLEATASED